MELDELKSLIELLKDTDVTELELEKNGVKVRIKRGRHTETVELPGVAHAGAAEAPSGGVASQKQKPEAEEDAQRLITVTAPLVGTFYKSPSPDAEPFAEAGSRIAKGQVICIIEAMKLMNEIESEVDGTLVKTLAENSQSVEYGEPLFLIEPD